MKSKPALEKRMINITSIILLLVVWELVYVTGVIDDFFFSGPVLTGVTLIEMLLSGELATHFLISLFEFGVGFSLAVVIGILVGFFMGTHKKIEYLVDPYVTALYSMPKVAFLPLIILFFGIGYNSKIFMSFLLALFPILINTHIGIKHIPSSLIDAARTFGFSGGKIFTKVLIPASLPSIIAGLRIGVPMGLIGVVVAEFYVSTGGLGYLITYYGNLYVVEKVFVTIFALATIGILLTRILNEIKRRKMPWSE